jgi:hypothetical protein
VRSPTPPRRDPAAQPHAPPAQETPAAHARPHAPQWAALRWVSTQALPQSVWPAGQRIAAHAPLVHDCPTGQTLPQRPQCAEAVFVFVSQPLARAPSQF